MKVFVIGGTKNVGARVVEILLANSEIDCLGVYSRSRPKSVSPRLHWYYGNRDSISQLAESLSTNRWELIIDFLCFDRVDAQNLISALGEFSGKLVMISSQAVYPKGFGIAPEQYHPKRYTIEQLEKLRGMYADQAYSLGKREAELVLFDALGDACQFLRLAPVIGPHDQRFAIQLEKIVLDRSFHCQCKEARISIADSEDAAQQLATAALYQHDPIVNVATGSGIEIERVYELVAEKFGSDIRLIQMKPAGFADEYSVHTAWETVNELFFLSVSDDWSIQPTGKNVGTRHGLSCEQAVKDAVWGNLMTH